MKPPEERMLELDWKGKNQTASFSVGDVFRCRFHRHGSVGEDTEFEIEDTSVLVHEDTQTEYLHPEHMKKPGWTGGDAERGYWYFKAVAPGETTLTIRILFRFEVESEYKVVIKVT